MVLLIDNYDSFTYNLVQYLEELSCHVLVKRNDEITLAEIQRLPIEKIILSPGPGNPDSAGITLAAIHYFAGKLPILGVCLGHQAIAQAFGAKVTRAPTVMHGKVSAICHERQGIFRGISSPFFATRYHSLAIEPCSLPPCLEITAWVATTCNKPGTQPVIMGIRHRDWPIEGVQFHPESILTEHGYELLKNFLKLSFSL